MVASRSGFQLGPIKLFTKINQALKHTNNEHEKYLKFEYIDKYTYFSHYNIFCKEVMGLVGGGGAS